MVQVGNDYQMLCADLDETLLVDFHIPAANRAAIKKMVEKGYLFTIASGRPIFLIEDLLKEIDLDQRVDQYTIALNGATIFRNDGQLLYEHPMSFKQVQFIYELSLKYQTGFSFFSKDQLYLINPIASELERRQNQKAVYQIVDTLEGFEDVTIYKCLMVLDDCERLRMIAKEQEEALLDLGLEISFSSNRYLECNDRGVNKGQALCYLADYLQIDRKKVASIGDNSNDITMLQKAGLGVAVGNATDDAKKYADLCLKERFDEMAVARFIEDYFLK